MEMDQTASDLKLLEMNQGELSEMVLTLFEQLEKRENEMLSKERQLEDKESKLNMKLKELKNDVQSIESLIEVKCDELQNKEREFARIEECIFEGAKKMDLLEKSIQQRSKEVESKSKELDSIQEKLKKFDCTIQVKERQLSVRQKSLEDCCKEVELRQMELEVLRRSIDEYDTEITLKKGKLESLENSIVECSNQLEIKEKRLSHVQELQEKNLGLWRKSTELCACRFEITEMTLKSFVREFESKAELRESKIKEFDLLRKETDECLKRVELKEKNFLLLQRSVEEGLHELEKKESQFERRLNDFRLRQFEFESIQKPTLLAEKKVKIEQSEETHHSPASYQSCLVKENKYFLVVLNEHLKKHTLICNEISTALKASLDPAKLALHAMQGIYHLNSSAKNHKFGESFVGRSCIVLSESLMNASSEINPQERNEAMKLARDWKAKIFAATENHFAVFGFLQFVASYGLASTIDANELRSLLDVVGLNGQALQLSSSICAVDKATDVAESIRNLIQRGETIHAIRHICELKFTNKFPLEPLLTEYLEYAQNYTTIMFKKGSKYDEAKKKVKDKEEAALRAVAECIKECNLESEFPIISLSERISKHVGVLENMGQSVNLEVEQSKKRRNNNFALQGQPVRIKIKIPGIIGSNNDALCANSSGGKNAGMPEH